MPDTATRSPGIANGCPTTNPCSARWCATRHVARSGGLRGGASEPARAALVERAERVLRTALGLLDRQDGGTGEPMPAIGARAWLAHLSWRPVGATRRSRWCVARWRGSPGWSSAAPCGCRPRSGSSMVSSSRSPIRNSANDWRRACRSPARRCSAGLPWAHRFRCEVLQPRVFEQRRDRFVAFDLLAPHAGFGDCPGTTCAWSARVLAARCSTRRLRRTAGAAPRAREPRLSR